jgi:menaquinone-9 beta-reductase
MTRSLPGDTHGGRRRAVVIGAGPAGLSSALSLARAGWQVQLRERLRKPGPRLCGSFLGPEALRHLETFGLMDAVRRAGGVPVRRARIFNDKGRETNRPLSPAGMALPRETLESILGEAAEKAGVDMRWGEPSSVVLPPAGGIGVLAAGRFAGEHPPAAGRGWYGWNAAFDKVLAEPGEISLHFHPGGYVGMLTFPDGKTNVCGLRWKKAGGPWEDVFEDSLDRLPSFKKRLAAAERRSDWRGVGPLPHALSMRRTPDGVFPVGDAAAVGDPFFGEGIGRALGAGPMLLSALAAADPAESHRRLWRRAYGRRLFWGALLRHALNRRPLLDLALWGAGRLPFPLE